jgi:hypothetical protein
VHQFQCIKDQNGGVSPALHPTLAALFIVFYKHANLAEICRDFPDEGKHMEYNPDAKFPEDITNLLPPCEKCWYETLGESSPLSPPHF